MKNTFKLFGIIALVAVIGFSMIACDGDDDGSGGNLIAAYRNTTWFATTSGITVAFGTDNVTISGDSGENNLNGTYTIPEAKNTMNGIFDKYYDFPVSYGYESFSIYVMNDGSAISIGEPYGGSYSGFVKQ